MYMFIIQRPSDGDYTKYTPSTDEQTESFKRLPDFRQSVFVKNIPINKLACQVGMVN